MSETASVALSNETIRYLLEIAKHGWIEASKLSEPIKKGINTAKGKITYKAIAESFNKEYTPIEELF